jgi:hypothetical protein
VAQPPLAKSERELLKKFTSDLYATLKKHLP